MDGRYSVRDADLVNKVADLERRAKQLVRNPRTVATAIDEGSLIVNSEGVIEVRGLTGEYIFFKYYPELNLVVIALNGEPSLNTEVVYQITEEDIDGLVEVTATIYIQEIIGFTVTGGTMFNAVEFASLQYYPPGGGPTIAGWLMRDYTPFGIDGRLGALGRFLDRVQLSNKEAVYTGSFSVGAGVSSATHTYASSFATTMYPILGLHSASGAVAWSITAQSATSFTVAWVGTTAKIINMWNIRM